jgi:hypothetical protein
MNIAVKYKGVKSGLMLLGGDFLLTLIGLLSKFKSLVSKIIIIIF